MVFINVHILFLKMKSNNKKFNIFICQISKTAITIIKIYYNVQIANDAL